MRETIFENALTNMSQLKCVAYEKGDVIIEEGSQNTELFFLESGDVEVVKDEARISTIHEKGSVFGEISILLNAPATATVRALTPTKFYHTTEPFQFLEEHPSVHLFVSVILAERLKAITNYLMNVKEQFADNEDHTNMIDGVMESLLNKQSWDH